jgi:hypothetical protein
VSVIVSLAVVSLPAFAQEQAWIKEAKDPTRRTVLHDSEQPVRGDSGKWNDNPILQHAPPIAQKPPRVSLDDWADQWLEKKFQPTGNDDNWLIFRTHQLDDNDRVWVQRVERRGNQLRVVCNQAIWQGRYQKTFTYYQVVGVNLGKLEPGKYEVSWVVQPLAFTKFDGDGRPAKFDGARQTNNWPSDERPAEKKPTELRLSFTVDK